MRHVAGGGGGDAQNRHAFPPQSVAPLLTRWSLGSAPGLVLLRPAHRQLGEAEGMHVCWYGQHNIALSHSAAVEHAAPHISFLEPATHIHKSLLTRS